LAEEEEGKIIHICIFIYSNLKDDEKLPLSIIREKCGSITGGSHFVQHTIILIFIFSNGGSLYTQWQYI
jgi:hypothetical protein